MFKMICVGPFTNKDYHRFGHKDSSSCHYCEEEEQDFKHLFEDCDEVNELRDRLAINWDIKPSKKEWLFGINNSGKYEKAVSFIAIELCHYVHSTNWKGELLSLNKYKGQIRATENIERRIAMKKLKMHTHEEKWAPILELIR